MAEIQVEDIVKILSTSPFPAEGEAILDALTSAQYVPSKREVAKGIYCLADFPSVQVGERRIEASAYACLPHWVAIATSEPQKNGKTLCKCLIREKADVTFSSVVVSSPTLIPFRDAAVWCTGAQWGPMLREATSSFPSGAAWFWYNIRVLPNIELPTGLLLSIGLHNIKLNDPVPLPLVLNAVMALRPPVGEWEEVRRDKEGRYVLWRCRSTKSFVQCLVTPYCFGLVLYDQKTTTIVSAGDNKINKAVFPPVSPSEVEGFAEWKAEGSLFLVNQIARYVPDGSDNLCVFCAPAVNAQLVLTERGNNCGQERRSREMGPRWRNGHTRAT